MPQDGLSRRTILKSGTVVGSTGLAALSGCIGGNSDDNTTQTNEGGSSGPQGTTDPESITRGGHLKVGWGQGMQSASPYKGAKADYLAKETMYDRLTRVNRNFEVKPNLAKKWSANDDFTKWTFELQENATFANMEGENANVTADDVKATVDYMLSKGCAGCAKDLGALDSVNVVDDYTVEISLTRPDTVYPQRICETGSTFCIAPKKILEDDPSKLDSTDYGSGPFVMTEWKKGNKIVFEGSTDYHLNGFDGNPLPYVDKMTWDIQPDPISRINSLTDGRINALSRLPSKMVKRAKGQVQVAQHNSGLQLPIILNTTIEPFSKPAIRKAIKYGMSRDGLLTAISDRGRLGHHSAITPIHKYYDDSFAPGATFGTTSKPEQAKQKLQEAGHGGGLQLPTLYYDAGRPEKQVIAQVFQQQMKQIGIQFDIQRLTEEKWLSNYWNTDGVWYVSNWSTRVVDSTIPLVALHSEGKWNTPRWSNEKYDKALQKAVTATDQQTRAESLAECQRIVHEEGPWLSTVYLDIFGAHRGSVQNYELFPTLIKDFLQYCAVTDAN